MENSTVARVFAEMADLCEIRGDNVFKVRALRNAAETIAALADKGKYDLLMMGSHGQGSLGNLVLGSVATKVMALCDTPVLLVR